MITQTYLESRPDLCCRSSNRRRGQIEGYYPTSYCIRYLAADEGYTVSLEEFVRRSAG